MQKSTKRLILLMIFFLRRKQFFEKNGMYWVASAIDSFEPIIEFLVPFCFQKNRSDIWDPKEIFFSTLNTQCMFSNAWEVSHKIHTGIINYDFTILVNKIGNLVCLNQLWTSAHCACFLQEE